MPLAARLKRQIVGLLHVGRLEPGSRLPSIRAVARETGVDHRAVSAAYVELEEEGLVEVRPASGVYVAASPGADPAADATHRWITEVFLEGWHRRRPLREAASLIASVGASGARCLVVDSVEDTRLAIAAELRTDFGLTVEEVPLSALGEPALLANGVDLVVTTAFHEEAVQRAVEGVEALEGVPVIGMRVNPEFAAAIDVFLGRGPVIGVVLDPAMKERAQRYFAVTTHRDHVQALTVEEMRRETSLEALESEGRVLITRAARRELGLDDYHLIPPPPTLLSPETARAVLDRLVERAVSS